MDGHDLLDGKTGIIFGALNEDSIAWSIARACHREGADFVLSNAPVARRLGNLDELAEETDSDIIWADATDDEELAELFAEVKDTHGTIDFIVHSIGMGVNVRKDVPYVSFTSAKSSASSSSSVASAQIMSLSVSSASSSRLPSRRATGALDRTKSAPSR